MTALVRLLAAVLLVASVACNRGEAPDTTAAKELSGLLDAGLGDGMKVVESATGPMTTPLASRATSVRPAVLRQWLETHGFQGGYSRVWTTDGPPLRTEVLTALVYHFFSEKNAVDFIDFSVGKISTSAAYTRFEDPTVPRSRVFTLTSRVAKATKFCALEWFPVERDAYVVTRCAPYPMPVTLVAEPAQRQLVHAVTAAAK